MNTRHFVYAIEVERTGSITQAADNLFMSQPTLSKAIKDLEETLGFAVFQRTPRGVVPTRKGEAFLVHARKIVGQIEKMERALHAGDTQTFSIAIPRAGDLATAVSGFISSLELDGDVEFDVLETSSIRVIDAVADRRFVLGILRCRPEDEDYFLRSLAEKGLQHQPLQEGEYAALLRADHPLANRSALAPADLAPYMEAAFGDDEVPYIRVSEAESTFQRGRRALVYARATLLDLLRTNPQAYAWTAPLPPEMLAGSGLVQRRCDGGGRFQDLLISRSGYRLSRLDQALLSQLSST